MSLIVSQFSDWDNKIFDSFITIKKELQGHLETFFPETLEDYKKLLHPDSPFAQDYEWRGFMIHQGEKLVGKAILAWRKNSSVGNLGFIDWINDEDVAKTLMHAVEEFAKKHNLSEIKTPIDLNFFVKYRLKQKGGGEAYYGEPIYPDYYEELFVKTGYSIVGKWDTYHIQRFATFVDMFKKRKKMEKRKHAYIGKVEIRLIKLWDWDNELKIVYDLFVRSFGEMNEFEPISFEQFKLIYDDFKYIVHPLMSYIAELDGTPVGFSINYPDPLEILNKVKHQKLGMVKKALLLVKLRLNFKTLLIPYMGKVPGPNGEDIKGIFLKFAKLVTVGVATANKTLVCYQSEDSPSRRPLDPKLSKHYASYVLYGKKL